MDLLSSSSKSVVLKTLFASVLLSTTVLTLRHRAQSRAAQPKVAAGAAADASAPAAPVKTSPTRRLLLLVLESPRVKKWLAVLSCTVFAHLVVAIRVSRGISQMGVLLSKSSTAALESAEVDFAWLAIPHSFLLAATALVETRLALACRQALAQQVHAQVERGAVLTDAHVATADVQEAARLCAELASKTIKPGMEAVMVSVTLARMMGSKQLALAFGYFAFAGTWSRAVTPSFKSTAGQVQTDEAAYRSQAQFGQDRGEELAFLGSARAESRTLSTRFAVLTQHLEALSLEQLAASALDTYFVRYVGILACFRMMAPALQANSHRVSFLGAQGQGEGAEYFLTVLHLLVQLMTSLRDGAAAFRVEGTLRALADRVLGLVDGLRAQPRPVVEFAQHDDRLQLDHVDVQVDGRTLIRDLSLAVPRHQNVLILGSNGVGKTSLLRVVGVVGCWRAGSRSARRSGGCGRPPTAASWCRATRRSCLAAPWC
jgi:ABC-type uncharacterized transport system fused permease/ATPase subunit